MDSKTAFMNLSVRQLNAALRQTDEPIVATADEMRALRADLNYRTSVLIPHGARAYTQCCNRPMRRVVRDRGFDFCVKCIGPKRDLSI